MQLWRSGGKIAVYGSLTTLLDEAGYNSDWIEKSLAHEQRGVRAVYNKAEYSEQGRAMMQDWADMVDRTGRVV
jgi:glucan phosphoethanolaminetransferase (alkaline phosphatase superfamily)